MELQQQSQSSPSLLETQDLISEMDWAATVWADPAWVGVVTTTAMATATITTALADLNLAMALGMDSAADSAALASAAMELVDPEAQSRPSRSRQSSSLRQQSPR